MQEHGSGPSVLPLPTQLRHEDVARIFGVTQPQELRELLQKCPRHYIRVSPPRSICHLQCRKTYL